MGKRMRQLAQFVPPNGRMGMYICIISYNDRITFGIDSDVSIRSADDTRTIVHQYMDDAIEEMMKLAK